MTRVERRRRACNQALKLYEILAARALKALSEDGRAARGAARPGVGPAETAPEAPPAAAAPEATPEPTPEAAVEAAEAAPAAAAPETTPEAAGRAPASWALTRDERETIRDMIKLLTMVFECERKYFDDGPAVAARGDARVLDLEAARAEVARRLDRLAAE